MAAGSNPHRNAAFTAPLTSVSDGTADGVIAPGARHTGGSRRGRNPSLGGAVLLIALLTAGCTGGHTSPTAAHATVSAPTISSGAAGPAAKADAQRACAPSPTHPRTLADVASNYARDSAEAAEAARLDTRWKALAMATSALANSWQVLQSYPTKPKHPLALNPPAMTPYQKQEYRRRRAIATQVYTTILVECHKASG